jgi:hypothetical protein
MTEQQEERVVQVLKSVETTSFAALVTPAAIVITLHKYSLTAHPIFLHPLQVV